MKTLAALQGMVFAFLALMHVYWAFGGSFGDGKTVPEVDGKPVFEPGVVATLAVAVGLAGCAFVAVALASEGIVAAGYTTYLRAAGIVLTVLFVGRAIGDFRLVGFFKHASESPFAWYDTVLYSPLCLLLGIGFAILTYFAK